MSLRGSTGAFVGDANTRGDFGNVGACLFKKEAGVDGFDKACEDDGDIGDHCGGNDGEDGGHRRACKLSCCVGSAGACAGGGIDLGELKHVCKLMGKDGGRTGGGVGGGRLFFKKAPSSLFSMERGASTVSVNTVSDKEIRKDSDRIGDKGDIFSSCSELQDDDVGCTGGTHAC